MNPTSAANAKQATKSVSIPVEVFSETTSDNLNILTGRQIHLGDLSLEIRDEWAIIALNHTSRSTATPKGVLHHREAYLNVL